MTEMAAGFPVKIASRRPPRSRGVADLQYPREGQVYSFQKMDHRPAMEFEINRATYAAASISISASRSAMTSSKAEIAC